MIRNFLAYLLVAVLIALAFRSMARAQEYLVPTQTFHASFTAKNIARGYRELFVIAFPAWNQLECDNGTGPLKAVSDWIAHHPDYSDPRDIHCAKPGEADL